jgi:hypothetical protein
MMCCYLFAVRAFEVAFPVISVNLQMAAEQVLGLVLLRTLWFRTLEKLTFVRFLVMIKS